MKLLQKQIADLLGYFLKAEQRQAILSFGDKKTYSSLCLCQDHVSHYENILQEFDRN